MGSEGDCGLGGRVQRTTLPPKMKTRLLRRLGFHSTDIFRYFYIASVGPILYKRRSKVFLHTIYPYLLKTRRIVCQSDLLLKLCQSDPFHLVLYHQFVLLVFDVDYQYVLHGARVSYWIWGICFRLFLYFAL
jgi:hypothetical protein